MKKQFGSLFMPDDGTPPAGGTPPVAPPAAPPSEPAPLLNDKYEFRAGWQNDVITDPDLRPTAAQYNSPAALAAAVKAAKQELSKRSEGYIKLPGDADPDEVKQAYRKAMGIPDTIEGYALKKPEGITEAHAKMYEGQPVKDFLAEAHAQGVPLKQAQHMVDWWLKNEAKIEEAQLADLTATTQAWEKKLKDAWGDKFTTNLNAAKGLMLSHGGKPDMLDILPPEITLMLASLAGSPQAKSSMAMDAEQFANKMDPADLARSIQMDPANPDHAAWIDPSHPNHKVVKERVMRLNGKQ